MKYDENFFVVNRDKTAVKVKGATYTKDKRLFVHRGDKGFILTDKATGLAVVGGKTLKQLDNNYYEKLALYNKVFNGSNYKDFKRNLNNILREGVILYECR